MASIWPLPVWGMADDSQFLTVTETHSPDIAERKDDSPVVADRSLAEMLPENTPVAIFISLGGETWEALKQFELFAKIAGFSGQYGGYTGLPLLPADLAQGLNQDLGQSGGVSSWIGDHSVVAILPEASPRRITVSDIDSQIYSVTPIVDVDAFEPFIDQLAQIKGEAPEERLHQGTMLWSWPARTESFENFEDLEGIDGATDEGIEETEAPVELEKAVSSSEQPDVPFSEEAGPEGFGTEDGYSYTVPELAIARIGNHVVLSQNPNTLKTLIDYQQLARPNLGENALFLRAQHPDADSPNTDDADLADANCDIGSCAIARIYANLSETSKFNLGSGFPFAEGLPRPPGLPPGLPTGLPILPPWLNLPLSIPPEARLLAAKTLTGVTFDSLVYPQTEGLRLQARLYGNEALRPTATPDLPYADSALRFVPAPTYALGSGRNMAGLWNRIANILSADETTRDYLDQLRFGAQLLTGLDLDTEIFGWMDREFALFFFPSNTGAINSTFPGAGIEVGLALQTSDRPTAQAALDAVGPLTTSFFGQNIAVDTRVNDAPAVSLQFPPDESSDKTTSFLSHSWVAEDTLIVTTGIGAMSRLLNAPTFEPLDKYPTFVNATQSLAHPNNGYSYVNAGSSLSRIYGAISDWLEVAPDEPFFAMIKSYLGTVYSLSGTTSSTREYWQLDSLINLAPARTTHEQPLSIE
ncbi:MAG: DUF3352 domain-containing protein [Phormidesmis sp.]